MEPVDIEQADCDRIEEEDDKWDDNFTHDLMIKLDKLKRFNATLETSCDKHVEKDITLDKLKLKKDMIELVANEVYDEMTSYLMTREKH